MTHHTPPAAARRAALLLPLALVAGLAGCGRPEGDFGRARPSFLHDDVLTELGRGKRQSETGPVARFDLTEDEKALRDRAWTFVRPPHVGDWWLDTLVEGQRVGILPVVDTRFDARRYHAFLGSGPYASVDGRWNKVIADIQADALLVPPFCAVAARVRRADEERLGALYRSTAFDPILQATAFDRINDNNETMAWVWRALGYRLEAYRYAIDRFEVEAPSDKVYEANRTFALLAGTRCREAPAIRALPAGPAPTSRIVRGRDPFDEPVLQK